MSAAIQRVSGLIVVGFMLAACGELWGPRTVRIGLEPLQRALSAQFPVDRRVLELFDVHVSAPSLAVAPGAQRLTTEFELQITPRLGRGTHRGLLVISHGLRYESGDRSVRLVEPRLERVELDGSPVSLQRALELGGLQMAEQLLDDRTLYRLSSQDLARLQGLGWRVAGLAWTTPRDDCWSWA